MSIEDDIKRLLELAAPLRLLEDDDPAKGPLTGIVDEINKLRAEQARGALVTAAADLGAAQDAKAESEFAVTAESVNPPKRGPGRPKKAE